MDAQAKTNLPAPRIEHMPGRKYAGLMQRHDMNQSNSIPLQWQKMQQFIGNVPGAVPGAAYGIVVEGDGDYCTYMCGMEITPSAELPPEFVAIDVPARRWARFTHAGHISTIRSTIGAIYEQWLPKSAEEQAEDVSFLEYYGPSFDPRTGMGSTEIWIGLKD